MSTPPENSANLQPFPTAPDGTINFTETYDLSNDSQFMDPINNLNFMSNDLFPLDKREIVLHGLTVPEGVGAGTPGAVDGSGGYIATLPVAAGEIKAVPESTSWLGVLVLGSLGVAYQLKKQKN